MELPLKKVPPKFKSPRRLFIYSAPKVGKTTLASMLDNNLIIDLESGTSFIEALKVEINSLAELKELLNEIKAQGKPYKYGTVDTLTKLEDMAIPLATKMYKETPMGVNFKGDNVLTLPKGAGYLYLREALTMITTEIESCFERVIYFGHVKDKSIMSEGKEVSTYDIDLTGKIRNIMCANSDSIGYMYREGDKTILTFKTNETVVCGTRQPHLSNKDIVIMEKIGDELVAHWDLIYID